MTRGRIPAALLVGALTAAACSSGGSDELADEPVEAKVSIVGATTTTTAASIATEQATTTTVAPPPTTTVVVPEAPTIAELVDSDRPLNIAHAGGDQSFPHSTMYAFSKAVEAGADVLEMDVRLTFDGQLVVHHDEDVFGTTGAEGFVHDLTLEELQELDNAYWWSPQCWPCRDLDDNQYPLRGIRTGEIPAPAGFTPDDFRIETFASIATAFPALPLDVEIKGDPPEALAVAEELAAELARLGREDSTIVVSFSSEVVAHFSSIAPSVATSPGTDEMIAWILGGQPLGDHAVVQVPPEFDGVAILIDAFFTAVDAVGVDVWVWPNDARTQENEAFYLETLELGAPGTIDGIIAGRIDEMESAIRQTGP